MTRALRSGLLTALLLGGAVPVAAQVAETPPSVEPNLGFVEFAADTLTYDENAELVTASGNVRLERGKQVLTADTVTWNRTTDVVTAEGRVLVVDGDGNRVVADRVELADDLRDGAIENVLLILSDGSRLAAASGVRTDAVSTLDRAVYSPCAVVDEAGCPQEPVWQLKAVRVRHDPVRGRVYYRQARLEIFGVPLVALPRFSHPDSFDRNQSGFLSPEVRFTRELGGELSLPYFLSLGPEKDVTVTGSIFTDAAPLLGVAYRHLLRQGPVEGSIRMTYGEGQRQDPETGVIVTSPARLRGYVEGRGQLQHGHDAEGWGWRSTGSLRLTNDDNFLGRYQISLDTRLRTTYALENFQDRSYLSIAGWGFQGLRPGDVGARTPVALPLVDYWWRPELDVVGGSLMVRANSLALARREGQSVARALASAQWDRRFLTPLGQRITMTALVRGDIYHTSDGALADDPFYAGEDGFKARLIPLGAVDIDWPLGGRFLDGSQTLTPRVQLVLSTASANVSIPNEDARAIELEDSNLFALSRFPGLDRWEGGARITYGADWQFRRRNLAIDAQVGQSYRLDQETDIFPEGVGLAGRVSDVVGRLSVRVGRFVEVTQRVRLDKDSLAIRRNETDVAIGSRRSFVSVGYLKFNRNIDLEDLVDHEEVRAGARVAIGRYWSVFGSAVVDLTSTEEDPLTTNDGWQPIRHRLGINYNDECFDIGLTWKRNYIDNPNARRGNTILFTLALRNLG
jgi:LPS-assembly protein